MRREDKNLFDLLTQSEINAVSKRGLVVTQEKSKQIFFQNASQLRLSFPEFLWQQSKTIQKKWWLFQLMVLTGIWIIINTASQNDDVKRMVGISASMFAMLIIPEIWKNRESGSTEIECTCMYTLRQINAARMLIFAFIDLLLLSLFGFTCITAGGLVIENIVIQFVLPYMVTCCICFTCFYSKIYSELLTFVFCIVWCMLWTQVVLNDRIYYSISMPVWWLLLVLSCVYLVFCIGKGQQRANGIWEVRTKWS